MNITLILGNGFDINLGLPTQYSYFYKYYLSLKSDNKERLIKKELKENLPNWADLEMQLGQVSAKYPNAQTYLDDIDDVSEELTRYMQTVDSLSVPSLEKAAKIVYDDLCDFTKYLDNPLKNEMDNFIRNTPNKDEVRLSVITFNYTSTFERILEYWRTLPLLGKIKEYALFHIHQKLDERGILLGVDNTSQIANGNFRDNYMVKAALVKPFINASFQSGTDKECEKAISQADIIILFGTSIGKTDQHWWDFIGYRMNESNKRLIYCPYNEEHITRTTKILQQNHKFSNFVANQTLLDSSRKSDVASKTIPIRENKMFNFKTPKVLIDIIFKNASLLLNNH